MASLAGALVTGLLLTGCSGAADPDPAATPSSSTVQPTSEPPRVFPAGSEDLCAAFADAQDAYTEVGGLYGDAAPVPDAWVDALHAWGDALLAAELPEALDRDQRDGVRILGRQLRAIPMPADGADVHRVESGLTGGEAALVASLVDVVEATCGLAAPGL